MKLLLNLSVPFELRLNATFSFLVRPPGAFLSELADMFRCVGVKLRSRGRSCWEIINYIFIKKTVWWWGRIWFILWFWLLLSTLSAVCSVSLHSGAARADQSWCHKRQRPLKQTETAATSGSCWQAYPGGRLHMCPQWSLYLFSI